MPGVPPPVNASPNTYPEYGVGGGTPGSSTGWNIVVASNASEKMQFASQGYLVWFNSRKQAQDFISSESSAAGAGDLPGPLSGIAAIGDFFQRLTQENTWVRVGEVVLGGMLLYVGVKALTSGTAAGNAAKSATKPIKKTVGLATTIAAPEAKAATKVAGAARAPRAGRTTLPPPPRPKRMKAS